MSGAKSVTCQEAQGLLTSDGYKYVDVRTPEEFAGGRVPGAINVPWMLRGPVGMTPNPDFIKDLEGKVADKATKLVIGCQAGKRSGPACAAAANVGYKNLADMSPGFGGWSASGLPVEN
jgi:rhodanese-related sulfurtransferase